jgi:hypothetical protein
MNLILTVSHNLFLSKSQRYELAEGKELEIVGVSVPVWFHKGKTSEPANEVFCNYKLIPSEDKVFVNNSETGYNIYLPKNQKNAEGATNPIVLRNLLDIKDGGIEWLAFRQFAKAKKGKKVIDMIHFVEIKKSEEFYESVS